MYPIGIRVVKVAGDRNIGKTGIVVPMEWDAGQYPDCNMLVQSDDCAINDVGQLRLPGWKGYAVASQWRPINPDADDETLVKDKELEEVL